MSYETLNKALDRIVALEAELAEARKDGERLDWCSRHGAMAVEWWQGGYRVVTQHHVWMTDVHDTPRAAIDLARGPR